MNDDTLIKILSYMDSLYKEIEHERVLRLQRVMLTLNPKQTFGDNMALSDTITLLENLVNQVVDAENKEDADTATEIKNLQDQIAELKGKEVTDEDMQRLQTLETKLQGLLPVSTPTPAPQPEPVPSPAPAPSETPGVPGSSTVESTTPPAPVVE